MMRRSVAAQVEVGADRHDGVEQLAEAARPGEATRRHDGQLRRGGVWCRAAYTAASVRRLMPILASTLVT